MNGLCKNKIIFKKRIHMLGKLTIINVENVKIYRKKYNFIIFWDRLKVFLINVFERFRKKLL